MKPAECAGTEEHVTDCATATSTQSELPSSDWSTNMVFVDLKSLRHLFIWNVCRTTKSHVARSARQGTSRFTDNFPIRADFSLATSQKGSGLLLWILSSSNHAGTGKTRKICSLTYLSNLVVSKKSCLQVHKWGDLRWAPERRWVPQSPSQHMQDSGSRTHKGAHHIPGTWPAVPSPVWFLKADRKTSASSLQPFSILSMEKDKAAEQSSEYPFVPQALNDHCSINTDTPGWFSSLQMPQVSLCSSLAVAFLLPGTPDTWNTAQAPSSTKADAPQDQHCRASLQELLPPLLYEQRGPDTPWQTRHRKTCWCWLL